jgi:uncharacterized membrane protein YgcG
MEDTPMPLVLRLAPCLVALGIAYPLAAQAPGEVKDQAGFFKLETIKKANEAIEALNKKGIRLAVETYPTVPKESIEKVKEMDTKDREKFFQDWALKHRVKELGENTILILMTNEPKHLETAVGSEARKKFSPDDRKALTDAMLQKLRNKLVDDALIEAVTTLRKHFDTP